MSTVVLLVITGFGLGAMYFLIASGLSLMAWRSAPCSQRSSSWC